MSTESVKSEREGFSLKKKIAHTHSSRSIIVPTTQETFSQPNFSHQKYARERFISLTVDQVKQQYNQLLKLKQNAAEELKTKVYHNYPKFIAASREIGHLEADLLELGNLLTELNSVINGMKNVTISNEEHPPTPRSLVTSLSVSRTPTLSRVSSPKDSKIYEIPNELERYIVERKFEEAVSLIEKANKLLRETNPDTLEVKSSVTSKSNELSAILVRTLQQPITRSSDSRELIGLLLRLGLHDKARDVYLNTRSQRIEREIKKLNMEGDITLYISELAHLVFSSINHTCEDFRACFTDAKETSGFVVWAIGELEKFGGIFRNQVFHSEDFALMGKCLHITRQHCTMLEEKGLSLFFVLDQMFLPNLQESIEQSIRSIEVDLSKLLQSEQWISTRHWFNYEHVDAQNNVRSTSNSLQLTESAKFLFSCAQQWASNISHIISLELVSVVALSLTNLLEGYYVHLSSLFSHHNLNDQQCLAILGNSRNIVDHLCPQLIHQLEENLHQQITNFERLERNLQSIHVRLKDLYCSKRAGDCIEKTLEWDRSDYSQTSIEDSARPSPKMILVFEELANLKGSIASMVHPQEVRPLLSAILEEIALRMADEENPFWNRSFGKGGLQQCVLDLKFFLEAAGDCVTDNISDAVNDTMDRAILLYCKGSRKKEDVNRIMKSEDWFLSRIKKVLEPRYRL